MILKDFFSWYSEQSHGWKQRPWLVLGKGPTFAKIKDFDITGFNTFGLNHVVLEQRVTIAHAIDLDVIEQCKHVLPTNTEYLLLPWFPHVNNKPGTLSLLQVIEKNLVLAAFAAEGRLLWYNKLGSPAHENSPSVRVDYFSAEAPYALMGHAGAKTIRSLGVDGGNSYAKKFEGLPTLLANRQASFNKQFDGMARSIMKFGIDAAPLDAESPVRVYIATTEEQMLSVKVLEYSIRKHASMSVEVIPMHTSRISIPRPIAPKNWPRTPFSFQRFIIPEIAAYCGRAIYLDSDMQVFTDIRELWSYPMEGKHLLSVAPAPKSGRRPQYSVMLLDCAKLRWKIADIVNALDRAEIDYDSLMYDLAIVADQEARIPSEWNSLERYDKNRTKLVHYTDMNTQPWIYARNPLGYLWVRDLLEALAEGFIERSYVHEHVKNGWARPSLWYQVEHDIEDPLLLPRHVFDLDKGYSPPYHKLHKHTGMPWLNQPHYVLNAMLRRIWEQSDVCLAFQRVARQLKFRLFR